MKWRGECQGEAGRKHGRRRGSAQGGAGRGRNGRTQGKIFRKPELGRVRKKLIEKGWVRKDRRGFVNKVGGTQGRERNRGTRCWNWSEEEGEWKGEG